MSNEISQIKPLPLLELHKEKGAKTGEFAGWEVPLYYTGILKEHIKVRKQAGLFDVSHMGYFIIEGRDARNYLSGLLSASFERLQPGFAVYSLLTNEEGGIVDDVILYQKGEGDYFLIVNASNLEKDWDWLQSHKGGHQVELTDLSAEKMFFALQGPASEKILTKYTGLNFSRIGRFQFQIFDFQGVETLICRTGYTGEDGFEILLPKPKGADLWLDLLKAGEAEGLAPIGFGARDTLRLEARYPLYGHELNDETTPVEAGLNWAVDFEKEFIGSEKNKKQKEEGVSKQLIGFEVLGRQIPRQGYDLYVKNKKAGTVTSGCMAPTLKKNIGLGYVKAASAAAKDLAIDVRGERIPCKAVKGHFYIGESLKKFHKHRFK